MHAIVEVVCIRKAFVASSGIASSIAQQVAKVSLVVPNNGSIVEQAVLRMVLVHHFELISYSMAVGVLVSVPIFHSSSKRWSVEIETIYPIVDHSS